MNMMAPRKGGAGRIVGMGAAGLILFGLYQREGAQGLQDNGRTGVGSVTEIVNNVAGTGKTGELPSANLPRNPGPTNTPAGGRESLAGLGVGEPFCIQYGDTQTEWEYDATGTAIISDQQIEGCGDETS
jgi:hypothetical protein